MIDSICVAGTGKLGACIAASFAQAGIRVTGYDLDEKKVEAINRGCAPVIEPGLAEAIQKGRHKLRATIHPEIAVRGTKACIFVAPTPSLPDGSFDNQYLLAGIEKVAVAAAHERLPYLFIISSTVTPGSCDNILMPAIRNISHSIELAYKPEFIALGTVIQDFAKPDAVLIGTESTWASVETRNLYQFLQGSNIHCMSFIEAELAKISLNCAITMKISYANQVGMVARQLGADPHKILKFVGQDSRIGPKTLRPGMPFGGACFPRDGRMFRYIAECAGVTPHLAIATDKTNQDICLYLLSQVPEDGDVGILGIAYKAGTPITEESAGLWLKMQLLRRGRNVKTHDQLASQLEASHSLDEVCCCRTVIVTTDSPEYRNLKFSPETFVIDPMGVVQ